MADYDRRGGYNNNNNYHNNNRKRRYRGASFHPNTLWTPQSE